MEKKHTKTTTEKTRTEKLTNLQVSKKCKEKEEEEDEEEEQEQSEEEEEETKFPLVFSVSAPV